jgi:hypothetical protein
MTIDSVDHFTQKITDHCDRTGVELQRPRALHHTFDDSGYPALAATRGSRRRNSTALLGLGRLADDIAHPVAVYLAGGLVASCVVLAAKNVGSERHTWWGWLLIGAPLTWLCFLGMVVLTFGALHVGVKAVRWCTRTRFGTRLNCDVRSPSPHPR